MRRMRNPYEPFLTSLGDGDIGLHELIVGEGGDPVTLRGLLSRRGPHTTPTRVLLAAERLTARSSPRRAQRAIEAGRAFAADVAATIGDGVMLHPPYQGVAPRHGRTVGRLWWAQPMAVFNLAAVPVTQVPLGLGRERLPLGVQVAAGPGPAPPPRLDRRRGRAGARLRRLGPAGRRLSAHAREPSHGNHSAPRCPPFAALGRRR
jgi:fatty acid amide hydrolase 2